LGDQLMGWIRSRNGSSRGQTIVEFALIAPVIFILLFGIIDFGMALDRRITLQHAVREGARYGAVTTDIDGIKQRTVDQARGIVEKSAVEVCYEDGPDGNTRVGDAGDIVKVSAPFEWEFPLVSRFGVGPIDVSVSGSARLELTVTDAPGCGPTPTP